jgi:hypothetical protein
MKPQTQEWWRRIGRAVYSAVREVFLTAIIALTPVWVGAIVSLLIQEIPTLREALAVNTARGDLYLLATAAVAPLTLYLTVHRGDLPKPLTIRFPASWLYVTGLIIIFCVCTIMFSLKRASEIPGSTIRINHELFYFVSVCAYIFSLFIALFVTTIRNFIDEVRPGDLRTDTADFVSQFVARRGDDQ